MHDYEIYGYSVFETFLARQGTFWELNRHWSRLSNSAQLLGLDAPDWDAFLDKVREVHDKTKEEVLRYTLLKTGGRWSGLPSGTETRVLKRVWRGRGDSPIKLQLADERISPEDHERCFKTGSRLFYQFLFDEAKSAGYDDCLVVDRGGKCLETTTGNFIYRLDGAWHTPPATDGLLPGIAREWLIHRFEVTPRSLSLAELEGSVSAVLVSNAVLGLVPAVLESIVTSVDDDARAFASKVNQARQFSLP